MTLTKEKLAAWDKKCADDGQITFSPREWILLADAAETALALQPLAKTVHDVWQKHVERYERAGSNQHNSMPGHWPVDLQITTDQARTSHQIISALPKPEGG